MSSPLHITARRILIPAAFVLALPGAPLTGSSPASAAADAARFLPKSGRMRASSPMRAKDFAFIKEGEYFHLFWMRHDASVPWDSTEKDLGHAVSRDLYHWTQLDPVLPVRPGKWDDLHVWAPTILKQGSTFYLYYTGVTDVPYGWNRYQRIGLATSTDLLNWTRADRPVLSGATIPWVLSDSSRFAGCQFRDPFAMPDPDDPGRTLLYYAATPAADSSQLIIGVAQTDDMFALRDLTPLWSTGATYDWGWCESPHMVQHNGLYYLFTTTNTCPPIRFRTAKSPVASASEWSGEYRLSDMANQDPNTDLWFASEVLSIPGHDYLAVVNSFQYWIDIYEIVWDPTPPGFTLTAPKAPDNRRVPSVPAKLDLSPIAGPGPGPGIMFRVSLPAASDGRVDLYDVGGRLVRTLRNGPLPEGESVIAWDGRFADGANAPPGMYFAALTVPEGRCVARVTVAN